MVENNIFNQKKMKEFMNKYSDKLAVNQLDMDPVNDWINRLNNNTLEKEKENYLNFKDIILERLLGYKLEDLKFEHNPGSEGRPVEFTLKQKDKEYVIVEVKGTKTKDLNKRYDRQQSAIEQATNYASIKKETRWAIVTNYDEFRLFNPNYREQYISFKFKELEDEEILKQFLLTFSKFSLIEKDIPKQLLNETIHLEKNIEDEFYQLFSETRLMIIKELEYSGLNKGEAIRYAQLILNRYIFVCFAEDIGLIPSETTTKTIQTPINNQNLFDFTIWDRINELFRFIDKGNPKKDIAEFNGGLFQENLRHLEIRDIVEDTSFYDDCKKKWKFEEKYKEIEKDIQDYKDELNPIYKNLLVISSVDFESELDVNILGHIFENSIGDLEELKDQTKTRRKKDGVYYTPEYITDYICRNTIIPYLSKSGKITNVPDLIEEYRTDLKSLDRKLRKIKIIDPACGSGAFLNKAADILLEIHEKLYEEHIYDDELNLNKWFNPMEERKNILLNNIYGVDLNEESVELTKLSMFIKVAQKGMKLPTLDNNIKCGNSLIDDEEIVGNKAFKWEEEFDEIFKKGGFDVVIGNPPYGAKISDVERNYLKKKYSKNGGETVVSFIKNSYDLLLKNKGKFGFIMPKSYLYASNYKEIRDYTMNIIETIIDCGKVWKHVKFEEIILLFTKNYPRKNYKSGVRDNKSFIFENNINKQTYTDYEIVLNGVSKNDIELAYKIKNQSQCLNDFSFNQRGGTFQNKINDNGDITVLGGNEIQREGIIGIKGKVDSEYIKDCDKCYINDNSILVQRIVSHLSKPKDHIKFTACIPNNREHVIVDTINQITVNNYPIEIIWALINSKLINWYSYKFIFGKAIRTMQFDNPTTSKIPIKEELFLDHDLKELSIKLNKNYEIFITEKTMFIKWLIRTFNIEKISQKIDTYYKITFEDFLKELKKKKVNVKSREKQELLELEYNKSLKIINDILEEINDLNNKINRMIYDNYLLTQDEVEIIENDF